MKKLLFWPLLMLSFWLALCLFGYFGKIQPEKLAAGGLTGFLLIGSGGAATAAFGTFNRQNSKKKKPRKITAKTTGTTLPKTIEKKPATKAAPDSLLDFDESRRLFLKAVGSLSIGALLLALFKKDAAALSFGGTGYPDPVGLKNTAGTAIDPATETKQDTLIAKFLFDDYQYTGSQTSGSYVYYGFKQKSGTGWYIMRKNTDDDSAWAYAYSSDGGSNWITAWGAPGSEVYSDPPDS